MLTKSGVKLLDFGLAKAFETPGSGELTSQLTAAPPSDLTAGEWPSARCSMAPEQLEGRPADARSDIFALGAVLYEMATGRKAFPGKSAGAVASAILRDDRRSIAASPSLDRLVRVCLAKDPDERWQTAHDVQLQLASLPASGPVAVAAAATRARGWAAGLVPWGVAALAAAVAVASVVRPRPRVSSAASASVIRFSVPPPPGGTFWDNFENVPLALSPDGLQLAFVATEASGTQRIWLRTLSAIDARPVAETDGALSVIWSPDSRSIAFFAGGKLKRLDLPAGAAVTLCDFRGSGMSGTLGPRRPDPVCGGRGRSDLSRSRERRHAGRGAEAGRRAGRTRTVFPWYLPDGRRFLYPPGCWMARG